MRTSTDSRQITEIVVSCVRQIARDQTLTVPEEIDHATKLFGNGGIFDSLALVALVVLVERNIRDRFGNSVSLADDRAMSQERSPFRTVGSLSEYAESLLGDREKDDVDE